MPPMDVTTLLQTAIARHQSGQLAEAETLYRQVLRQFPQHPDALHLLGLVAHHRGQHELALDLIRQALAVAPRHAPFHGNLGLVLQALGRQDEAANSYRQAISINQDFAEAHLNLGNVLLQQGEPDEAIASYQRALRVKPQYAEAHFNLGRVYERQARREDALHSYRRAIALRPEYVEAHFNLGNLLHAAGEMAEATASFRHVVALDPGHAAGHNNLGAQLEAAGQPEAAIASYRTALALQPGFAEAHNNLGNVLQAEGRFDEAVRRYELALAHRPGYTDAISNLGNALQAAGRLDDAIKAYDRTLAIIPGDPGAEWNKSFALLLKGDFATGWRLFESRWPLQHQPAGGSGYARPLWLGDSPLDGKTLLVHHEQGLGDTLQMLRYVPLLAERGARVIVQVPGSLAAIAATVRGVAGIAGSGEERPAHDLHCPCMSLPLAFGTTLASVPAEVPYLFTPEASRADWQRRLGARARRRIGLAWSGSAAHRNDRQRSLPLRQLLPLLAADADFHSLQKEYREGDRALVEASGRIRDFSAELGDFTDTAGLIEQLDLVISVDSAVAHLAGALGKPVWLLLPFGPDYRWLLNRPDSPWYPTMRLFRQPRFGDWDSVVHDLCARLARS